MPGICSRMATISPKMAGIKNGGYMSLIHPFTVLPRRIATKGDVVTLYPVFTVLYDLIYDSVAKDIAPTSFHFSKEEILPYYSGWVLHKRSRWEDLINEHVLRLQEASEVTRNQARASRDTGRKAQTCCCERFISAAQS